MNGKVKRNKFINDVRHHIADMKEAEAIADLAEQAGMEWLPEEPELPERLTVSVLHATSFSAAMLKWERMASKTTHGWYEDEDRRVYREAAACYNALHNLFLEYDDCAEPEWAVWMQERLDEERAKLRTP